MPAFMAPFFLCFERVDADAFALFSCLFEPYLSVDQRKQRVVAAYSNVAASLDDGAALAHQNRAGAHD